MGITNDLFRDELGVGLSAGTVPALRPASRPRGSHRPRDAATRNRQLRIVHEVPCAGRPQWASPRRSTVGEQVFASVGCASCHVPVLTTGAKSRARLFDQQSVALFSDLLLHDIGTGDDIPQANALPEEIRTPALWGLRLRRPLLHDGSAATIDDAIGRHAGEAERARRTAEALPAEARAALLAFLKSL